MSLLVFNILARVFASEASIYCIVVSSVIKSLNRIVKFLEADILIVYFNHLELYLRFDR